MSRKLLVWIFVVLLLVSFVFAENAEGVGWEELGAIQDDPVGFAQEIGINSISGDLAGVEYDKGANTLTNGATTILVNEIQGADIIALRGGGFEIKKAGPFKIGEYNYELPGEASLKLNNDGGVELPDEAVMKTEGITITAKGGTLIIHYPDTLPDMNTVQFQDGNHIYLTEDNKFILKGIGEISIEAEGIKNIYKGEHLKTIIGVEEGNTIYIGNPEKFNFRTTIARSWHDTVIRNTNSEKTETITIEDRYISKENKINILSKATDIGGLGDVSKANYEIIKHPNVKIDVGDGKVFELDKPDFVKKNILLSFSLDPSTEVLIKAASEDERKEGKVARLIVKKSLVTANTEIQIDPETLQDLINYYKNIYSGAIDERNENFIYDLLYQEQAFIPMTTSVEGGAVMKGIGKAFSFFGAKTDPDEEVRKILIETGKKAGLGEQDWENFEYIVSKYKTGQMLTFDSMNPQPIINIVDNEGRIKDGRIISKEAINRIRDENIGRFLKEENLRQQFQGLADKLLK